MFLQLLLLETSLLLAEFGSSVLKPNLKCKPSSTAKSQRLGGASHLCLAPPPTYSTHEPTPEVPTCTRASGRLVHMASRSLITTSG